MNIKSRALVAGVVIAAIAGTVLLWQRRPRPVVVLEPAPPAAPVVVVPPEAASAPAQPAVKHPIQAPVAAAQPPLEAGDIAAALTDLLGRKALLSFLQLEDFPRRFVATVDSLGRTHAPAAMWPVNPTPERFVVVSHESGQIIGADNSMRYTPFVLLVETIDIDQAVDLYVRMYSLLQKAYEDIGFPGRYFNDRLIEVIDQLLATPDAGYPVKVQLTQVKGPIPSVRPWVRYEFADPALESLSAGQKILLRVGPVNERRLKARLTELRRALVGRAAVR
jgi:hypothetical protein